MTAIDLAPGSRLTAHYAGAHHRIEILGAPFWGATRWHPVPCWLVTGLDLERGEMRVWAVEHLRLNVPLPERRPARELPEHCECCAPTTRAANAPPQ